MIKNKDSIDFQEFILLIYLFKKLHVVNNIQFYYLIKD